VPCVLLNDSLRSACKKPKVLRDETIYAHEMGCVAGYGGATSLRVRPHVVFHLPVCPMVAPYLHGIRNGKGLAAANEDRAG
jgi:hypothetical protein